MDGATDLDAFFGGVFTFSELNGTETLADVHETTLQSRIAKLESQVSELLKQFKTSQQQIKSLETSISTMESYIDHCLLPLIIDRDQDPSIDHSAADAGNQ
jgi:hypothetical protein